MVCVVCFRQVESWWKDVGEPTVAAASSLRPENVLSAGRSLPIQHSVAEQKTASVSSEHSSDHLLGVSAPAAQPPDFVKERPQSLSLSGHHHVEEPEV